MCGLSRPNFPPRRISTNSKNPEHKISWAQPERGLPEILESSRRDNKRNRLCGIFTWVYEQSPRFQQLLLGPTLLPKLSDNKKKKIIIMGSISSIQEGTIVAAGEHKTSDQWKALHKGWWVTETFIVRRGTMETGHDCVWGQDFLIKLTNPIV